MKRAQRLLEDSNHHRDSIRKELLCAKSGPNRWRLSTGQRNAVASFKKSVFKRDDYHYPVPSEKWNKKTNKKNKENKNTTTTTTKKKHE